jgi:hypothetical protein
MERSIIVSIVVEVFFDKAVIDWKAPEPILCHDVFPIQKWYCVNLLISLFHIKQYLLVFIYYSERASLQVR